MRPKCSSTQSFSLFLVLKAKGLLSHQYHSPSTEKGKTYNT